MRKGVLLFIFNSRNARYSDHLSVELGGHFALWRSVLMRTKQKGTDKKWKYYWHFDFEQLIQLFLKLETLKLPS